MVRPRLYGRCDIHNRELRRRRIAHCRLLSFTESLALGNAGLSIFSLKNFPANFSAQALIREQKPSVRYRPHSTFPVKPSETPVFRTSPSKGHNPSTNQSNALKSPRFSCPLTSDICTTTGTLAPTLPKIPRFSTFS